MKSLNKSLQEVREYILQNSFSNTVYHKMYNFQTFDVIVIFKGCIENNSIEMYNVMVIDLMTGKISTKYSHTLSCIKDFFGKKIAVKSSSYDASGLASYYYGKDIKKAVKRYKTDGIKISAHIIDEESEKDVRYNKVIVKKGNQAFAVVCKSPIISTGTRTTESIPFVNFLIYYNDECYCIDKSNVFKILKCIDDENIIKIKKGILLLFRNMNKLTEENKKELKMFLGAETNRLINPICKNEQVTIQLYNALGINYRYNRYHKNESWYNINDETMHCYGIMLKENTPENKFIASRILENIVCKNETLEEYKNLKDKFAMIQIDDDYVLIDCDDCDNVLGAVAFIKTKLGTVRVHKGGLGYSSEDYKVVKRYNYLVEYAEKRILTLVKLTGKSKREVVNMLKQGN